MSTPISPNPYKQVEDALRRLHEMNAHLTRTNGDKTLHEMVYEALKALGAYGDQP